MGKDDECVVRQFHPRLEDLHVSVTAVGQWRPRTSVTWLQFDDSPDWVVYNPDSAAIHLVSDSVHRLWQLIGERPAEAAGFAAAFGALDDPRALEAVDAALDFMDRAGLIEPVAPVA